MTDAGTFTIAAVLSSAAGLPGWATIALAVVAGFLFLSNVKPPARPS
jgi:NAD/NADP transhydrogenase alpha subunit